MDCDAAIKRYCQELLAIIAGLFTLIALTEGGMIERVSKKTYRKVLALLRPAESAIRRLIVLMARDLEVAPQPDVKTRTKRSGKDKSKRKGQSRPSFPLFDPLPREGGFGRRRKAPARAPRVWSFDEFMTMPYHLLANPEPAPKPKPEPDDTVSAKTLCRRLARAKDALSDLKRHALRYARMRAKALAADGSKLDSVLRRGPPPGLRRHKKRHEVHEILDNCHWLARSLAAPDTS